MTIPASVHSYQSLAPRRGANRHDEASRVLTDEAISSRPGPDYFHPLPLLTRSFVDPDRRDIGDWLLQSD
jgi:hypothetical protein